MKVNPIENREMFAKISKGYDITNTIITFGRINYWYKLIIRKSELKTGRNSTSQGVGRPCYEAENSACRGEWRREAGSPASVGAPNVGTGKRVWRAPIPPFCMCEY